MGLVSLHNGVGLFVTQSGDNLIIQLYPKLSFKKNALENLAFVEVCIQLQNAEKEMLRSNLQLQYLNKIHAFSVLSMMRPAENQNYILNHSYLNNVQQSCKMPALVIKVKRKKSTK